MNLGATPETQVFKKFLKDISATFVNLNRNIKSTTLVDILERDWRFRLGEEFRTTFGRNLGNSLMTISVVGPNTLRCEEHHEERPEWRVTTTFEFYQLGKEEDFFGWVDRC